MEPMPPVEEARVRAAFRQLVNMTPVDLRAWLDTDESGKVGQTRRGETESIGRKSAKRILEILCKGDEDLTDADLAHMRKTVGFCRRHLAQRPNRDVTQTRWRWSLMNWGHDPCASDLLG